MGQQQLLLIVLSVIIVGIAVVVGIQMFGASAASANLEAVSNDLLNLASRAQQYYVKPKGMGGGGNSFADITLADLTSRPTNDNGTYSIQTPGTATLVVLKGVGNQDGDDVVGNCEIWMTVFRDSIKTEVKNR